MEAYLFCINCLAKFTFFFLSLEKIGSVDGKYDRFHGFCLFLPLNQSQFHRTAFVQKRRTIYCGYNFVLVGVPIDTDIEKKYCNYSSCFVRCRGCRKCRATKRQNTTKSLSLDKLHRTLHGWYPSNLTFVINAIRKL